MKKSILPFLCCTLFIVGSYQNLLADEQQKVIEELEKKGISIGRLSDDPHQKREEVVLSEAEVLMWETEQLENIDKTGTIRYEFERKGSLDEGFTDAVELNILKIREDGMKSAAMTFFTGDRNQNVPPNENTNSNPVLGIYLQGDVYEMNRLTEGNWRYFHRRIKFALAENAKIESLTINVEGKDIQAKKITITPYVDDPKRSLFEQYADKVYEVTLSEEIPGMLYQIRTVVPPSNDEGEEAGIPLVEETLVYAGVDLD